MTDQSTTADQASQQTTETASAQNADATAATTQQSADKAAGTMDQATAGKDTAAASAAVTGDDKADTGTDAAATGELQKLRETLAGGDATLLKQLERYRSTDAISKAFKEARIAAQNGKKPLTLAEKATEDEVKAYREAMGIPDEAKDYPVSFRKDFTPSDADTEILESFKAYLHEKNADPRAAGAALEWYQDFATAQQQQLDANLAKTAKETQAALRTEWGGEYDGNLNAAGELMKTHLGDEGFGRMMDLRLADGSRLQDDAAFVKMMAQLGADYYGGNAIFNGDIETTAKTVQERIDELLAIRVSDPEKYKSDEVQSKITKLYSQRDKINAARK